MNKYREHACSVLGLTKVEYNWFRQVGDQLHKIYEDNCNGLYSEEEYEKATNVIYEMCDAMVDGLKLFVYYQTDPRGATIYLSKEEIPEDQYSTFAVCIY